MFTSVFNLFAATDSAAVGSGSLGIIWVILLIAIIVLYLAGTWKVYKKAGKPGWAAIIPIYNQWTMFQIAGKPGWWALLYLIPIVNIISLILFLLAMIEIAKRFGKSGVWGFFLLFLLPIGWPILGFGDAQYQDPEAGGVPSSPADNAPISPQPPVVPPTPPATPVQ